MYTNLYPLSSVLCNWRKSRTFYHFIHTYFSIYSSQIKIHTLLLKISKPASFLFPGLSIDVSRDKDLIICPSFFWTGSSFFSSHLLFYTQGQNLNKIATLSIRYLYQLLALCCLENPTQRFALETALWPHRMGYTVKQLFDRPGESSGSWQICICHWQIFMSIYYLSSLIDVTTTKREI